uniref:SCAN box domain-containing protein n=1 Tax=Chelonoidis abingdonii TaxID=106734 RepID=A0A8C0JGR3_CHEAB
ASLPTVPERNRPEQARQWAEPPPPVPRPPERVAQIAWWAPDQWATLLAPYLMGTAQTAYRGISTEDAKDYPGVKAAILDALDVSPETFRQRFRGLTYGMGARPRLIAQELRDLCKRWLQPNRRGPEELLEQIILEQFLNILPSRGRAWVSLTGHNSP